MPFLILAIIAPRLAAGVRRAAYRACHRIATARDVSAQLAHDIARAEVDAAEWRRDLGLDRDGEV